MRTHDCEALYGALEEMAKGRSTGVDRAALEAHLSACARCAGELAFLRAMMVAWPAPARAVPEDALTARIAAVTYRRRRWSDFVVPKSLPLRVVVATGLVAAAVPIALRTVGGNAVVRVATEPRMRPIVFEPSVNSQRARARVSERPDSAAVAAALPRTTPRDTLLRPLPSRSVARPRRAVPVLEDKRVATESPNIEVNGSVGVASASVSGSTASASAGSGASFAKVVFGGADPTVTQASFAVPRASSGSVIAFEDETGERAAYQAGLTAQSDASRAVGTVVRTETDTAATRLAVVQAPVVTGNR